MPALFEQESGGRAGARGPHTQYGQALGIGQTLPDTARQMAANKGLAWRPDLLTGTSGEAKAYQQTLSQAYFEEGLAKTGNVRDALHYYHGGPNRDLWGPKTRRYADAVIARLRNR
jgi:hypothetical protein